MASSFRIPKTALCCQILLAFQACFPCSCFVLNPRPGIWAMSCEYRTLTSTDPRRCLDLQTIHTCSAESVDELTNSKVLNPPIRRQLQKRSNTAETRKPRGYWKEMENVEREFRELWLVALRKNRTSSTDLLPNDQPPPIPNFALLRHWQRNDLIRVIQYMGKEELSCALGGAVIIPGKWNDAVRHSLVQKVVDLDVTLAVNKSPLSTPSQNHAEIQNSVSKRQRKNWSEQKVLSTMYKYLDNRRQTDRIPSVWMPRMSEIERYDRGLKNAIVCYFGSAACFCKEAGLVSFHEWNYFERQFDLLVSLRAYCDRNCGGDYSVFPPELTVYDKNHTHLCRLIQDHGGSKFVASRFGISHLNHGRSSMHHGGLNWGPFDLPFAIALMDFVRSHHMRQSPPLLPKQTIFMPTRSELLNCDQEGGKKYLHEKIMAYGGYENVARRMGLEWDGSHQR